MKKKDNENFESRLKRLQNIVEGLEQGELPLEKAMALYKEGVDLARSCREELQNAKHEITIYTQSALKPFDPERGAAEE
jgi:exodeoxyribonuclease VII small subunit